MYLPYSGLRVGIDGILIPTGELLPNPVASVNDFWSSPSRSEQTLTTRRSRAIVERAASDTTTAGSVSSGGSKTQRCNAETHAVSRNGPYDWRQAPVAHLSSAFSGIQMEIFSEQQAIQMYSCHGQNGSSALKQTQGFFDDASRPRTIQPYGCVVRQHERAKQVRLPRLTLPTGHGSSRLDRRHQSPRVAEGRKADLWAARRPLRT